MNYPMFDPLLDAVFVMGPQKEIYYCNEACVNLFDLPRKRIISGAPTYELFTFDDPELFIMPDGTKGEKKMTPYKEVRYLSCSGKEGLVQVTILPTQELFGRNKLWFVYFHDVTLEETLHRKYRRQLEEKEKALQQLREPLVELNKIVSSLSEKSTLTEGDLQSLRPVLDQFKSSTSKIFSGSNS